MKFLRLDTFLGLIFVSATFHAFASDRGNPPGFNLELAGYTLDVDGLREAFDCKNSSEMTDLLRYLEENQVIELLPDLRLYLADIDYPFVAGEERKLMFVKTILALDKAMDQDTLDGYLVRIRRMLFDVKDGDPDFRGSHIHSYLALLAAQEYQHVDIREDLARLSLTDVRGAITSSAIRKWIELYGDEMSDDDVNTLLHVWRDNPDRLKVIRHFATREERQRVEFIDKVETFLFNHDTAILRGEWSAYWLIAAHLALVPDLERRILDDYLAGIRSTLFDMERKHPTWPETRNQAYAALLAAQEFQGVDISSDLACLSESNDFVPFVNSAIARRIRLYGVTLSATSIEFLLETWRHDPEKWRWVHHCLNLYKVRR